MALNAVLLLVGLALLAKAGQLRRWEAGLLLVAYGVTLLLSP